MIGTTVSHYKILEKVGEGGMGIVYKAQDLDLDRVVALKFLPEKVVVSDEERERFIQEAKSAAALNHSNICTIYGIEKEGTQNFISMEYIDGGTLREKVPFKKIEDAIAVAIQIGDGLQEAHEKGIVHRDIKADNIMVTSKGQAKVMDFGLAKLKGSLKLTKTSSTVGTLGYMAPEQIQGGEVDAKSDIFSFGVLLFEMLTGRLPFRGEHDAAMVYSIVNEEPQEIEELREDTPPLVVNLIQRCLEKDPTDRFHHMDDITSELRRVQKKTSGRVMRSSASIDTGELSSGGGTPSGTIEMRDASPGRSPLLRYGIIGAAVFLAVLALWFLLPTGGVSVNPDLTTRVLQLPYPEVSYSSISADGNWIAFPAANAQGTWDIYYSHVSGREPKKITNDRAPFVQQSADISPDGSQVAYIKPNMETGNLDSYVVSSLGGQSRKIAERCVLPRWRPDGKRIGFLRGGGGEGFRSASGLLEFWTVAPDGSDERLEFVDSVHSYRRGRFSFCWSPDGKSVGQVRSLSPQSQVLMTHDLESGEVRQISEGGENIDDLCWTPNGDMVFSSNRGGNTNLWVVPVSGGDPVQITKGSGPDISMSMSGGGNKLLYLQQATVGNIWLGKMDGSEVRQLTFDDADTYDATLSPDGKMVAFVMNDPDPLKEVSTIFVMDRNGSNRRQIVSGNSMYLGPTWSPDSRYLAFGEDRPGPPPDSLVRLRLNVVNAMNPGPPREIGIGFPEMWIGGDHVLSGSRRGAMISAVDGSGTKQFFSEDSIFGFASGRNVVYYDGRSATEGWWIGTMPSTGLDALMRQGTSDVVSVTSLSPKRLSLEMDPADVWETFHPDFIFYSPEKNDLRKFYFLEDREERINGNFPGIASFQLIPSQDGKELLYKVERRAGKLVMIEDLYR